MDITLAQLIEALVSTSNRLKEVEEENKALQREMHALMANNKQEDKQAE